MGKKRRRGPPRARPRQVAVWQDVKEHPNATVDEVRARVGGSYGTIKMALHQLRERGEVMADTREKMYRFTAISQEEGKLEPVSVERPKRKSFKPKQEKVLGDIVAHLGATTIEIQKRIGGTRQSITDALLRLRRAGAIRGEGQPPKFYVLTEKVAEEPVERTEENPSPETEVPKELIVKRRRRRSPLALGHRQREVLEIVRQRPGFLSSEITQQTKMMSMDHVSGVLGALVKKHLVVAQPPRPFRYFPLSPAEAPPSSTEQTIARLNNTLNGQGEMTPAQAIVQAVKHLFQDFPQLGRIRADRDGDIKISLDVEAKF